MNVLLAVLPEYSIFHWNIDLAPVVQRLDNFIQWISHYPTLSICAKISVFSLVQVNMHTLKPQLVYDWTTFNMKYILDPE